LKVKSNKIIDIRLYYLAELNKLYPDAESRVFLDMIFEEYFGLSRIDRQLKPHYRLTESEILKVHFAVKQLIAYKPIQYVLGKAGFFGLEFAVNEHVLIPRPETEELVKWIIDDVKLTGSELKILDVGTGSGCIAIALKKNLPKVKISAIDISDSAISIAVQNAIKNNVDVNFQQLDIFAVNDLGEGKHFDVIVSNPPYVRESEKETMSENVLQYEPPQALFVVDSDPLIYYRQIALWAKYSLNRNGKLYLEINQYLGKETIALLKETGFNKVELRKDINGNDRMIKAWIT